MHFDEDGEFREAQAELLLGTQGGHRAGEALGVVVEGVVVVEGILVAPSHAVAALEGHDAGHSREVDASEAEGDAQLDVGGEGLFAVELVVVAQEIGVGLQASVFARISDVSFELVGGALLGVGHVDVFVGYAAVPIVGDADVEAEGCAVADAEVDFVALAVVEGHAAPHAHVGAFPR